MDDVICIFNPEHDLCLSNGSRSFMPPASALSFAEKGAGVMRVLYPDAALWCPSPLSGRLPIAVRGDTTIVAWGWNLALKYHLSKVGVEESMMPSDEQIAEIRRLQHRSTALPLQSDVRLCRSLEEVECGIADYGDVVLKSPLSGSGRGLRWISGGMVENDRFWVLRQLRQHQCLMLEPRREVVCDFAFEYHLAPDGLSFMGYSLFDTRNGVYRGNVMWSDESIERHLCHYVGERLGEKRAEVEAFLKALTGRYCGPLGVDLMLCREGGGFVLHVAEINFRHTMGLVAHEVFRRGLAPEGSIWSPEGVGGD